MNRIRQFISGIDFFPIAAIAFIVLPLGAGAYAKRNDAEQMMNEKYTQTHASLLVCTTTQVNGAPVFEIRVVGSKDGLLVLKDDGAHACGFVNASAYDRPIKTKLALYPQNPEAKKLTHLEFRYPDKDDTGKTIVATKRIKKDETYDHFQVTIAGPVNDEDVVISPRPIPDNKTNDFLK